VEGLELLAAEERGDVRHVQNIHPPQWRLRVGDWRVRFIWQEEDRVIRVIHVRHRSQAYNR
jgi:mRNA-degrading endonuclease RelE of RelBE toxin-antitoxin system